MTFSKIKSVVQEGNPWQATDCMMYPQRVVFEDGTSGLANAKTPVANYKAGDLVGYLITGQDKQRNNKLKIDRKAAQGQTATSPLPAQQNASNASETAPAGQPASTKVEGVVVGMCLNKAVDVAISTCRASLYDDIISGKFDSIVHTVASHLIREQYRLSMGQLAAKGPPPVVAAAQTVAAQHGFVPVKQASAEEDVPF